MTKTDELTAQAIKLSYAMTDDVQRVREKELRTAIEQALAEARNAGVLNAQPVAWIQPDHLQKAQRSPFLCRVEPTKRCSDFVPIYTHPPHPEESDEEFARQIEAMDAQGKPRKPLTDEDVINIWRRYTSLRGSVFVLSIARAVERAHGIGEPK